MSEPAKNGETASRCPIKSPYEIRGNLRAVSRIFPGCVEIFIEKKDEKLQLLMLVSSSITAIVCVGIGSERGLRSTHGHLL